MGSKSAGTKQPHRVAAQDRAQPVLPQPQVDQRLDLVRVLDGRGLFSTRNAAAHAGRALGVSRTTVYALLKEARS